MQLILYHKWYSHANVHVRGYGYDADGHLLREKALCLYFAAVSDAKELEKRLREANGLFAVVIEKGNTIIAATDRIRRYPLFYTKDALTDDPHSLSLSGEWDELGKAFYNASGAVLPGHTLLRELSQLPPASYGLIEQDKVHIKPYTSFLCTQAEEKNGNPKQLTEVLTSVFRRLIDSVDKRQIVVPLTAGNDSRLILTMLRRMNYSNVICYTVEGPGGTEWEGAHEAAQKLGYPHYKIDMEDEAVRRLCFADKENFEQYYRYIAAYTNFCWLYEYVAVRFLESKKLLEKDAVFVPGHSGDMIAGTHLIKAQVGKNNSAADLTRRMVYVGFEYGPQKEVSNVLKQYFKQCLNAGYTPYSAYQNWVVQHRQAHNIVHSARAYDFCGYDVRLPLWDNDLYDLFAHLPFAELENCRLYLSCVQQLLEPYGLTPVVKKDSVSWLTAACRKSLKKILPIGIVRRISKTIDPVGEKRLSETMSEELNQWYHHPHTCINSNELMLQWYLMRVAQKRG